MPVHGRGGASCLLGRSGAGASPPQARSVAHARPHPRPHSGPHVLVSKLPSAALGSIPVPSPLCWKELPCPGHADKYGNSVFIGCINISVCTYNSYIIVQGLGGRPTGRPQQHGSYPSFPQSPAHSVQTEANSSCPHFLAGEVTVWRKGSEVKGVEDKRACRGKTHEC